MLTYSILRKQFSFLAVQQNKMNQKKDDKQRLRLIAKYTSAAFQMAAIIVLHKTLIKA